MPAMTVAKLARAAGVGVETVRYYQRRGLMPEPARSGAGVNGGIRRYSDDDVQRLKFIRAAQAAGFTLAEVAELLKLDATSDRAWARKMANERIAAIDEKIEHLKAARDALARLARRCAGSDTGPCPILTSFEPATHAE